METFIIEYKDSQHILYSPLSQKIIVITDSLKRLLENPHPESLDAKTRAILDKVKRETTPSEQNAFIRPQAYPEGLAILPTFKCNLDCIYCYSHDFRSNSTLNPEIAKRAIDQIFHEIKENGGKVFDLRFHGGGEPTSALSVIKSSIHYARKRCEAEKLELKTSISTNGTLLGGTELEFLAANIDRIQISLDGYEKIQNMQRPRIGNRPSFHLAARTMQFLDKKGKAYSLRSTITSESIDFAEESITYLLKNFNPNAMYLEPVSLCGSCGKCEELVVDPLILAKKFIDISEKFKNQKVVCSSSDMFAIRERYCGACGSNFVLTPEGFLTTCLEVSSPSDPLASLFFFGVFNEAKGKFEIDNEKLAHLQTRTIGNMPGCSDCFMKYNCSGDCLTRTFRTSGDLFDNSKNDRCATTREIGRYKLIKIVETSN